MAKEPHARGTLFHLAYGYVPNVVYLIQQILSKVIAPIIAIASVSYKSTKGQNTIYQWLPVHKTHVPD